MSAKEAPGQRVDKEVRPALAALFLAFTSRWIYVMIIHGDENYVM